MAGCAQDRGRTGGAGNYEALGPEVAIASHRRQMNVVLRLGAAGRSAALLARVLGDGWSATRRLCDR
jgi:hypothetical protein